MGQQRQRAASEATEAVAASEACEAREAVCSKFMVLLYLNITFSSTIKNNS